MWERETEVIGVGCNRLGADVGCWIGRGSGKFEDCLLLCLRIFDAALRMCLLMVMPCDGMHLTHIGEPSASTIGLSFLRCSGDLSIKPHTITYVWLVMDR